MVPHKFIKIIKNQLCPHLSNQEFINLLENIVIVLKNQSLKGKINKNDFSLDKLENEDFEINN